MEYKLDPDFEACSRHTLETLGIPLDQPNPKPARGDIDSRRAGAAFIAAVLALDPEVPGIVRTQHIALAEDGYEIQIVSYRKQSSQQGSDLQPAVLYIHGGGMIFGTPELFEPITKADVACTGVTTFSVDYRLAPEYPHPTPVKDCYAALVWLSKHALELGIDNSRIAVCGISAGGGLAAGLCLMARDTGLQPPIAKQILLEPMLDDRNTSAIPELEPFAVWSWDDNWTGWNALLGGAAGSESVSAYAAPARAQNLTGLPPTYIDVGTLDIFAKEDEDYATRVKEAGVKVEWHLYQGVPHAFELHGRGSGVLRRALTHRRAAISSF